MITSLDLSSCSEILKNNYIGNLAYICNNEPYVIPITYFYNAEEKYIICYSGMGHKVCAMRKQTKVSMSVTEILAADTWKSVLAHGTYKEVNGIDAKAFLHQFSLGIKDIILQREHKDLDYISEFSSKIYNDDLPIVFLIRITEITGKSRSRATNNAVKK